MKWPPICRVANGKVGIRKPVGELLPLPGLSATRDPTKVEAARHGGFTHLTGTYELTCSGSRGTPVADQGKPSRFERSGPTAAGRAS